MSVELELEKIMNQNQTRKKIMRLAKKNDVSYETAKTIFESTLKEMLNNKEYWSNIEVRPS